MQLSQLETILDDDGIIFLTYGGLLTQALIVGMTEALEKESETHDISMKVSHNLLTIFIELSQNMMNYSKKSVASGERMDSKGLIIVGYDKDNNDYYVLSRNIVSTEDKEKIIPKVKQVLSLDKEGLKLLYRELRKSGRGKHEKGAGIGFVEMARRCDSMECDFTDINGATHYYALKATIHNSKD